MRGSRATILQAAPAIVRRGGARPSLAAYGLVALLVLAVLGPYMSYRPGSSGEGNPLRQALYFVSLALVIVGTQAWRDRRSALPLAWPVAVVLGWCWLSLGWSDVPALAVRRLILTTLIIWTLFAAVRALGYARSIAIFRAVAIAALAGNFLTVLLWPESGVHYLEEDGDTSVVGAWRGMMISKNIAGPMCAFTILAFLFDARRIPSWLRWSVIVGAAIFLWGTQSKTSGGILAIALASGWLFTRYNPAYRALMIPVVLVAGAVVALVVALIWDDVAQVLYDPAAFTGRAQIWAALVAYHGDHWMGAGYGSFWNVGDGVGPIYHYGRGWVTTLATGHNGYLDLAAQIGTPGVLLVAIGLLAWPITRLLASRTIPRQRGAMLLAVIIFCIGQNLTESTILDRDAVGQVVLMFAIALVAGLTQPVVRLSYRQAPEPAPAPPVERQEPWRDD